MKRTIVLAAIALAGLLAALLLPKAVAPPPVETPRPGVAAPLPVVQVPSAGAGSLSLVLRPAKSAFLAGGDEFDVVAELRAVPSPDGKRAPVDLALVLDRSGSMSGQPIAKAREAAADLVRRLNDGDRLSIVHFGSEARLAFELSAAGAGGRERALAAIQGIASDGGTNMGQALQMAEKTLSADPREKTVRRVVLMSDGQANEGLLGPALVDLADRFAKKGIGLSALGLGVDYDEDNMRALADHGGGQYRYLKNADELSAALTQELAQASATAASGIQLALDAAPGVEVLDAVSYELIRDGSSIRIAVRDIAAGETRRIALRVRSGSGGAGLRELIRARVVYSDVLAGGTTAAAHAAARAEATTDARRVAESYDRDAAAFGLRARLGGSVLGAMKRYESSDVSGAVGSIMAAVRGYAAEADAIGAASLAGELRRDAEAAASTMRAAPTNGRAQSDARKNLKNWGTTNAGN